MAALNYLQSIFRSPPPRQQHHLPRPRPPPWILLLPSELIYSIQEFLPVESVAAFSLTCKPLYAHYKGSKWDEEPVFAKPMLLQLLEKDNASYYICKQCNKLHPWRRREEPGGVLSYDHACPKRSSILSNSPPSQLDPLTAFLAMRHHRYGDEYGPGLEELRIRRVIDEKAFKVTREQSWDARIIPFPDRLYLHVSITLFQKHGDAAKLREYIDCSFAPLICCHVTTIQAEFPQRDGLLVIPELNRNRHVDLSQPFREVFGRVRSCRHCFTDIHIIVKWQSLPIPGRHGWIIKVEKWQKYGKNQRLVDDQLDQPLGGWPGIETTSRWENIGEIRSTWEGVSYDHWKVRGRLLEANDT